MKPRLLISAIIAGILAGCYAADATMPSLTPKPNPRTPGACKAWAAKQDEDAIYMWGTEEDGTHSRSIALDRLARSCLGQRPPDIIGFGSSIGFDESYCAKHAAIKLCKELSRPPDYNAKTMHDGDCTKARDLAACIKRESERLLKAGCGDTYTEAKTVKCQVE